MCVSKSEGHGSFFGPQVSEMSENISLKMGVKFAISFNLGDKKTQGSCDIMCKNAKDCYIPCHMGNFIPK